MHSLYIAISRENIESINYNVDFVPVILVDYDENNDIYSYTYTKGAEMLGYKYDDMPDYNTVYKSNKFILLLLLNLFGECTHPYSKFLKWSNNENNYDINPLKLYGDMAFHSLGPDVISFPRIFNNSDNIFKTTFFVDHIRYLTPMMRKEVKKIKNNQKLYIVKNTKDKNFTLSLKPRDTSGLSTIGHCPKHISKYLDDLYNLNVINDESYVTVILNNKGNVAAFKLLCEFTSIWPEEFKPYDNSEYQLCENYGYDDPNFLKWMPEKYAIKSRMDKISSVECVISRGYLSA